MTIDSFSRGSARLLSTGASEFAAGISRSPVWVLVGLAGALLCAVWGSRHGWAYAVGGLAMLAVLLVQLGVVGLALLNRTLAAHRIRLAVAVTLAVDLAAWWWANQPAHPVEVVAAALVLGGAYGLVGRAATGATAGLRAANLPAAPDEPPARPRWPIGVAVVVLCAVATFGGVAAVFRPPTVLLLGLAVVGALLLVVVAFGHRHVMRQQERIRRALAAYAPVYSMPYNGVAIFHLAMWAPYLQRAGHPVVIVTTEPRTFEKVGARHDVPVVLAADTADGVAQLFPPTVRAAFYVYNGGNRRFLQVPRVRHVFLHHGDSDKIASAREVSARYDVLVMSGQAGIERYERAGFAIAPEKFLVLGRPQTETIETAGRPIAKITQPKVLYAPTWCGKSEEENYSSLVLGPRIVRALLDRGAVVIFRPHPAGRGYPAHVQAIAEIKAMLKADRDATGRRHKWAGAAEKITVAEVTNLSDAMVADVSGIVTDYMQSLKPFAMVSTKTDAATFRRDFPTSQSAYVIEAGDPATIEQALDEMLGPDPLAPARAERRRYYLGGFDQGESARAFVDYVRSLA